MLYLLRAPCSVRIWVSNWSSKRLVLMTQWLVISSKVLKQFCALVTLKVFVIRGILILLDLSRPQLDQQQSHEVEDHGCGCSVLSTPTRESWTCCSHTPLQPCQGVERPDRFLTSCCLKFPNLGPLFSSSTGQGLSLSQLVAALEHLSERRPVWRRNHLALFFLWLRVIHEGI